ncbi:transketolase [Streptomyces sp. NPDC096205]|uniref:transketolase n=1 Tax=Streptomyces sp. NPDC096205 TaxID=3366081 RepID=UPI00381DEA9D
MSLSGYEAYRNELTALARHDGRIVCLDASPGRTDHPFELRHPDRFFGLAGVASAMVDVVSGMVAAGFRPFVCTGPGPRGLGTAGNLGLRARLLEAGASVVTPYAGFLEDYQVLRRLEGVTLAAPCGDAETRAVVRAAAATDRPFHIRVGTVPRPYWPRPDLVPGALTRPVAWESPGHGDEDTVCLVSVGEYGTGTARAARALAPWLAHAHLVYLDDGNLAVAAAELARSHSRFLIVGARTCTRGMADALARHLPDAYVDLAPAATDGNGNGVTETLRAADRAAGYGVRRIV